MIEVTILQGKTKLRFLSEGDEPIALSDLLHELEKAVIGEALTACGGVKAKVAILLKMNRTTLVEKSKRYGFPLKK